MSQALFVGQGYSRWGQCDNSGLQVFQLWQQTSLLATLLFLSLQMTMPIVKVILRQVF